MKVERIIKIFFSPTDTTKKIVSTIAESLDKKEIIDIDLTRPDVRNLINFNFSDHDALIIGVPVLR